MPIEIERKFLVIGEAWRRLCHKREKLVDGLVAAGDGRKVRVRLYEGRATLTVKGPKVGLSRDEYEYPIPVPDATELIAHHCGDMVLEKTRHYVAFDGYLWQVDEYAGLLAGLTIAEVELESETTSPPLPEWIGREITDDPAYRKINLLRARLAQIAEPRRNDAPGWRGV